MKQMRVRFGALAEALDKSGFPTGGTRLYSSEPPEGIEAVRVQLPDCDEVGWVEIVPRPEVDEKTFQAAKDLLKNWDWSRVVENAVPDNLKEALSDLNPDQLLKLEAAARQMRLNLTTSP